MPFILYSRIKLTDASKLQDEYAKLVAGLQDADADDEDPITANPGTLITIDPLQKLNYLQCYRMISSRKPYQETSERQNTLLLF